MNGFEKLKKECKKWARDTQTEEEAMAVSIFLEMIEKFRDDEKEQ